MSEETTQVVNEAAAEPQASPFSNDNWVETPPEEVVVEKKEEPIVEIVETKKEEEILNPKDWLKKEFETDDIELIKSERAEYKKLKEAPPATEYKFENEESKKMAEAISKGDRKAILKILETQDRLEALTTAEVTDDTAADIIKLGMQLKYKDLSASEIDYKYNKEFAIPREPIRRDEELDEEYDARKAEWQERVADIKMNRNIEAKLAKPELEKLKSTIVLPELDRPTAQASEPTAEELQKVKAIRENFLQKLDSDYSKVEGFTTKVKDESVELPISFKIPDEDKVAIKERLKEGFDVNSYIDKRWFDDKGNPKIEQMISDIFQLENPDKILSGIANKSASERLLQYQKTAKNINLGTVKTHQQTFSQNGDSKITPFSNDAWSESPTQVQN
jgi:hypothetical protein